MAVQTTIARHFGWRCIIIAIVCLVMGLWGVYDYIYAIPARELAGQRGRVCNLVKDALEPGGWETASAEAKEAVAAELTQLGESSGARNAATEDEARRAIQTICDRNEESWLIALAVFDAALREGEPPLYPLTGAQLLAHEIADQGAQAVATVKKPSALDRPTQWAFIACLPFVPYYLWVFFSTRSRQYRLDDDGALHTPEGTLAPGDIADIDMSNWMRKSIAYVITADGRRIKLDDYKHRHLHLIIGAIASERYPDQWHPDAKQVKPPDEDEPVEVASLPAAEDL